MKFLKLKIHMHDAFMLSKIKTLEIDFTKNNAFIILGSNGSGKSSLLKCLLSWPEDHSRYASGGYKQMSVQKGQDIYHLTCQYNGKDKYILIKNEEELYKGSHAAMFSQAVSDVLGFNKSYNSLLLESASITSMNASQRSQWLMDLSGTDYKWALELYDKLKSQRNSYASSVKIAAQRLASMSASALEQSAIDALKQKQRLLDETLSHLYSVRTPQSQNMHEVKENLDKLDKTFKTLIERFNSDRYISSKTDNLNGLKSVLEHLKVIENRVNAVIDYKYSKLQELNNKLNLYHDSDESAIKDKINAVNGKISELNNTFKLITNKQTDAQSLYDEYSSYQYKIVDYFKRYQKHHLSYNEQLLSDYSVEVNKANSRANALQVALERISSRIEHYEAHLQNGQVQCPKCDHSFISGYNEKDYHDSKEKLSSVKLMIKNHDAVAQAAKSKYEDMLTSKEIWYEFKSIVSSLSFIQSDVKAIMQMHIDKQIDAEQLYYALGAEYTNLIEYQKLIKAKDALENQLKASTSVSSAMIVQCQQDIDKIKEQMDRSQIYKLKIHAVIEYYNNRKQTMDLFEKLIEHIKLIENQRQTAIQNYNEVQRQHYFEQALSSIQKELAIVSTELKQIDQSSAITSSIKASIEQDQYTQKCWSALASAMSPKDGIIAKSLVAFLQDLFEDINSTIESIWNYELKVEPIKINEDGQFDMDYNFGLIQDGKRLKDISQGSEAMKSIVDLAFRLTALLRINDNGLLFLDEPYTSFDSTHRQMAANSLKDLIDSDIFEQVFVISHYSELHEIFTGASVICLDSRNITVPSRSNLDAIIEYY